MKSKASGDMGIRSGERLSPYQDFHVIENVSYAGDELSRVHQVVECADAADFNGAHCVLFALGDMELDIVSRSLLFIFGHVAFALIGQESIHRINGAF